MKKRPLTLCLFGEWGSSLVELLVAVLVFVIGLAALLAVFIQSSSMGQRAQLAYTANNLARSHLETLRSVSFNDLPYAAESSTVINENNVSDLDGHFLRTTTVGGSYLGDPNLSQVTVSVKYLFRGAGSASAMQVAAVYYRNG